jgi:hypothetical protein
MGDEKKSDAGKEQKSGLPQMSAMHIVIAVAVIVLAVIFVAKFGFGMDLLNSSSGEMAIVKRPVVTPVRTLQPNDAIVRPDRTLMVTPGITVTTTTPVPDVTTPLVTATTTTPIPAVTTQSAAATTTWPCTDTFSDPHNCGGCGNDCTLRSNVEFATCVAGTCNIINCANSYANCNGPGKTDPTKDGCESNVITGKIEGITPTYVCQKRNQHTSGPYITGVMNCGVCGEQCTKGGNQAFGICVGNGCQYVCNEPFLNCDNDQSNGCEQIYDDNNCGSCGAKCPTGALCKNGCCVDRADQAKKVTDSHGFLCSAEDAAWNKGWSVC